MIEVSLPQREARTYRRSRFLIMHKLLPILNVVIVMVSVFVCNIITSAIFPNLEMIFVSIIGSVVGGCISFPIMILINKLINRKGK